MVRISKAGMKKFERALEESLSIDTPQNGSEEDEAIGDCKDLGEFGHTGD